jgi:hypothetical protein
MGVTRVRVSGGEQAREFLRSVELPGCRLIFPAALGSATFPDIWKYPANSYGKAKSVSYFEIMG